MAVVWHYQTVAERQENRQIDQEEEEYQCEETGKRSFQDNEMRSVPTKVIVDLHTQEILVKVNWCKTESTSDIITWQPESSQSRQRLTVEVTCDMRSMF